MIANRTELRLRFKKDLLFHLDPHSLHWLILGFLYALFVQWSLLATIKNNISLSAQSRILNSNLEPAEEVFNFLLMLVLLKSNCLFCLKAIRAKNIVLPKEMKLSISIETFLNNSDITNRKLIHSIV